MSSSSRTGQRELQLALAQCTVATPVEPIVRLTHKTRDCGVTTAKDTCSPQIQAQVQAQSQTNDGLDPGVAFGIGSKRLVPHLLAC